MITYCHFTHLAANLFNDASTFMAEQHRPGHCRVRHYVEVGMAQSGGDHSDHDLVGAGLGHINRFDTQGAVAGERQGCLDLHVPVFLVVFGDVGGSALIIYII
ncbi:hypothetical protein D3C84_721060 [compost metagenome]